MLLLLQPLRYFPVDERGISTRVKQCQSSEVCGGIAHGHKTLKICAVNVSTPTVAGQMSDDRTYLCLFQNGHVHDLPNPHDLRDLYAHDPDPDDRNPVVVGGLYLLQPVRLESVRQYGEVGQVSLLFPSSGVSHQLYISN